MKMRLLITWLAIIAAGAWSDEVLALDPAGMVRTELVRGDLAVPGREIIQFRVEMAPGKNVEKHIHPGDEVIDVLEGTVEFEFEDQHTVVVAAGQSLFIASATPHTARNPGKSKAVELVTYVVEIGKTLLYTGQ